MRELQGLADVEQRLARRLGPAETARWRERGAVGEAFGYYFNRQGQPVYQTASFGLRVEDLAHCGQVVVVGGGRSKAEAALAVISTGDQDVLITDEGLAWRVLELTEGPRSEEMAAATSASR
ncbi:MAG: hypothetical protein GX496_02765 [Firmicutes bacterium]|nr:hypothetical protein [Bacillota bacterium]